jgi:hypothetical protein
MMKLRIRVGLSAVLFGLAVLALGCGGAKDAPRTEATPKAKDTEVAKNKPVDDHSGWWCAEHGIPEEECSMCSSKVAKEFKAKGDWCEMHKRAKSQCFKCDPSLKEKFAAKYKAKFGTEPPPIED